MSDDGKTFEEILSESLAGFGWTMTPSEIPEFETARQAFQDTSTWYNGLDGTTQVVLDKVNVAPGMKEAGFFDTWPALERIFTGPAFGANSHASANFATCFNNAFNRQFQPQPAAAG